MQSDKSRHRLTCKLLLIAILMASIGLMGLVGYAISERRAVVRGSAGPLFQSAPGKDPAPVFMRPSPKP